MSLCRTTVAFANATFAVELITVLTSVAVSASFARVETVALAR